MRYKILSLFEQFVFFMKKYQEQIQSEQNIYRIVEISKIHMGSQNY